MIWQYCCFLQNELLDNVKIWDVALLHRNHSSFAAKRPQICTELSPFQVRGEANLGMRDKLPWNVSRH